MSKKAYVLIDTVSIQHYIFNSNKLKINLGASHIVAHEIFNEKRLPSDNLIYTGGGNALLEFVDAKQANDFVKRYSLNILITFPGLRLCVAIEEGDIDNEYSSLMERLTASLKKNKHTYFNNSIPFRPGIVADCSFTNEGATDMIDGKLASHSCMAKNKYFDIGEDFLIDKFGDNFNPFTFPNKFEDLGQSEGKGYIAVVHIDGNGIGNMFRNCNDKMKLKQLSDDVKKITKNVLAELLKVISNNMPFSDDLDIKNDMLPFRPIIVGGDDITFVCEGRLGIPLAKLFLELYKKQKVSGIKLEACAGVAIIKTKYPFFKAYELSEALLQKAKSKAKPRDPRIVVYPSYLAYEIIGSGNSKPSFKNIYSLSELHEQLKIVNHFDDRSNNWSQTKMMAYREMLSNQIEIAYANQKEDERKQGIEPSIVDTAESIYFLAHGEAREIVFPQSDTISTLKAIELREFYIPLIDHHENSTQDA